MKIEVSNSKGALIAFIAMLFIGVGFMVWGVVATIDCINFDKNCKKTVGIVVDYEKTTRQWGSTGSHLKYSDDDDYEEEVYLPIYEYTVDGKSYTVTGHEASLFIPENGEKGTVYYDPENPEKSKTVLGIGIYPTIALSGLVIFLIGAAFLLAKFKGGCKLTYTAFALLCLAIGIGYPITTGLINVLLFTIWFAIIGIIIIIKTL